ncbi:unnamed protein product [Paramecium primaurelia]|uniref:Nudix hydrolase domain-containing protein n=1 Tax=Paramecium primaurelia TaxID=5886 RepID=A0A8S1KVE1_PARPR|nr:unnamed protein product [Paramecium primaurelia]
MNDHQNDLELIKAKVVDINNHVIDFICIDQKLLSKVIHQATYLFIIEQQSLRVFCHKRSQQKQYQPGALSTCFTGIVLESEDYRQCAKRKLTQETGLELDLTYLNSFYYESKQNKIWGQIFYTFYDGQIINFIQDPKEVQEIELMSYREIIIREQNGEKFIQESMQALHFLNKRVLRQ